MLNLSRFKDESIIIETPQGEIVEVMICAALSSGQVKLGIQAPREIKVDRKEIYEAKRTGKSVDELRSKNRRDARDRRKSGLFGSAPRTMKDVLRDQNEAAIAAAERNAVDE